MTATVNMIKSSVSSESLSVWNCWTWAR